MREDDLTLLVDCGNWAVSAAAWHTCTLMLCIPVSYWAEAVDNIALWNVIFLSI